MTRIVRFTVALPVLVGLLGSAAAAEPGAAEGGGGEPDLHAVWSFTAIGQYTNTESPGDDDEVGAWFDQYEFTPNKGSDFPFQLGVREGALDLFRGPDDDALLQARLWSPTSNLGVSGEQIDDPFFDQRLDALTRLDGLALDLSYRRIRTEQLRLFPNTEGPGLVFDDRSRPDDRFYRDRTGFQVEGRARPYQVLDVEDAPGSRLHPELSVRGGYESRKARDPLRFHRGPSNDWLGMARKRDRAVGEAGAGLLLAPDGLFTLALDFDYEQLRFDDPVLRDGELGLPPPESRTIGFVPDTDRYTGTVRMNGRLGDRAVLEAGFLVSELEQVSKYTPDQRSVGLEHNRVRYYGANAAVDLALTGPLSFYGVFKFDRRENDIERDTALFDDDTQVDPFVKHWDRFALRGEFDLRLPLRSRGALGVHFEEVDRDVDFAPFGGLRILRQSSQLDGDTRIATLYARGSTRPWRSLRVDGELGYRWAPETGYANELDDNVYGELRASYTFAFDRPLIFSAYLRGSTGENDGFDLVSGQGPSPSGPLLHRNYERSRLVTGLTASHSPIERLALSASFFYAREDQDTTLDFTSLQRYFQDVAPIDFGRDGKSRYESHQVSLVLGLHAELGARTDGRLSWSFTHVEADYSGSDDTEALDLVSNNSRLKSDTHVVGLELKHRVMEGFEVLAGYRFQDHDDRVDAPVQSVASVVSPRGRSSRQHTATVGVTLTSAFFEN